MEIEPYRLLYWSVVVREDIPRLDTKWRTTIERAIVERLTSRPDLFGMPLRQTLRGYRKLRIGDYRVIYRIEKKIVRVVGIGHRSVIYPLAEKRISRGNFL